MESLYKQEIAHIQAAAFGDLARGAAPEIIRLLKSAPIQIRRVVDVGCGAGPLTLALVEAGFEVTAIDISAELLAIARAAVPAAHFINSSVYDVEIPACEATLEPKPARRGPTRGPEKSKQWGAHHWVIGPFRITQWLIPGLLQMAELTYCLADNLPRHVKVLFNCGN
jgi:SAM-dependent methyltransferase